MTKNFTKKTNKLIKKLIKEKKLKLYKMKIYIDKCTKEDVITICNLLLDIWKKISINRFNIFFKYFIGYVRELIIEIDGEICIPYLQFIFFSETEINELIKLKNIGMLTIFKLTRIIESSSIVDAFQKILVPIDKVPENEYEKIIDDLLLPNIRVINENLELQDLLNIYQYNKQICSRGGIVSKQKLERNVALER